MLLSALGTVLTLILCYFLLRLYTDKISADEKNRSKSNFLAKMSHEIRTPMNAIMGMAELILREPLPPEAYDHALSIKQASTNLLSIINDILDFSKIESGKMELSESPYFLSSVINDIVTIIRMRLTEKPVALLVCIDAKLPNKLSGDEVRLRQIIVNVLNNAVKYTEQGSITLGITGTVQKSNWVQLTIGVEDTGVGIKKENFNRIFGDFVQFDKERNRNIEGTGLGLAITRSLCQAMGGEITFTSEYGRGSAFTIRISQRILGSDPLAVVENPEQKPVLIYGFDPAVASILESLENLGVAGAVARTQTDFCAALTKQAYPFIFVSQALYTEAKPVIKELGAEAKVVTLIEYGAELNDAEVSTLTLPAHAISIAEVLNHEERNRGTAGDPRERGVRFIAPKARILLVDDIVTNLKVAKGLMAPYKMQVDICTSGAEAVRLVQTNTYDMIFMDHMMPGMDGLEATHSIRNLEGRGTYYKTLPIIALTANAVSGVREMFLQNRMDDFLSKPIELARLNSILQKWIPEAKREKYQDLTKEGLLIDQTDPVPARQPPPEIHAVAPLPQIEGVDVNQGIGMIGGSLDTYMDILEIFWIESTEKLRQLSAALTAGDLGLYTTYVHAVKSTAATIGARGLSEQAKALEEAGRSGDQAAIVQGQGAFFADFSALLDRVHAALEAQGRMRLASSESGQVGGDLDALRRQLRDLRVALDNMDVGKADEGISRLRKESWGDGVTHTLEEIGRHILLSDYDQAIASIDALLSDETADI
jgi:signal transduction histidine kinase